MSRLVITILWSSFLAATVTEGVFFSVVDPAEIAFGNGEHVLTPLAMYTIGFFFFWASCSAASALTCYLLKLPAAKPH